LNNPVQPFIPPAPAVHAKDLPLWKFLRQYIQSNIAVWPDRAFDMMFNQVRTLGISTAVVNDPEAIRHVMAGNAANYRRPISVARIVAPLGGHGLFLAERDAWKRQRRMLAPTFTPNSINLLVPHFHAAGEHLLHSLGGVARANLSNMFQDTALEAVLRALFSLPDSNARGALSKMVRAYVEGPGVPALFDGFATRADSFKFALRKRRDFTQNWFASIDAIIADRKAKATDNLQRDLLDVLLSLKDPEQGQALTTDEIRDQCATMIFAGSETTARSMFWVAYLVSQDQDEQARVHAELAAFPPEQVSTLADLQNWPRLRNVLIEAMRLYPPLSIIMRDAIGEDEVCGENIRKGTRVWISPWVLHRHRKFWEHPTAFMPDRFANMTAPWTQLPAYMPFGAGPRICIGLSFAMAEAQIVLAHLLTHYRIGLSDAGPVLPIGQVTIAPSFEPGFTLERR
jgi:cytochrome P450